MRVIEVPHSLDHRTVDELFAAAGGDTAGPSLLDVRRLRWVDPDGMLGLLAVARVLLDREGRPPHLQIPENAEVAGYLARMGFFREAEGILAVDGSPPRRGRSESDVLLEITPIAENRDVHEVVDRVQSRAGAILSRALGYPASAVVQFSVILSEVCQNVLEHADGPGWVAAQTYNWARRLGRHVVVIAVSDLGRGFRGSLADEHSARFGDRWSDTTALEAAFIQGLTRFPDSGRGQGIQQIRKQVRRWDGRIAVRSGTSRIADVPEWADDPPIEEDLPPFPGAQISIVLPARESHGS